ncbi:MAG TPA: YcxB family protein [Dongiaceae bacterium]|nr:YcxB family protein [Dongiaceae bacterium]
MLQIKYRLTEEDYAEIERERRGGFVRRVVRIGFGSLAGLVGVFTIWQAIFLFSWNRPFANVLLTCMGLICVWGGLEMPGLAQFLKRLSDPYAPRELQIDDRSITWVRGSKSGKLQWRPGRGFAESERFFVLSTLRDEGKWTIPKRAVTHELELQLRDLVRRVPAES